MVRRIPLKPFFAVNGVLLGILPLVVAGYWVAELRKIGWIQETPLSFVPYVPFLELQPTLEGLSLQLGISSPSSCPGFSPEAVPRSRV